MFMGFMWTAIAALNFIVGDPVIGMLCSLNAGVCFATADAMVKKSRAK